MIDTETFSCADIEADLARSAWHDSEFAQWFAPHAKQDVLFGQAGAASFFADCSGFAKKFRSSPASVGDASDTILQSPSARVFYSLVAKRWAPLPGGRTHKPTAWQIEKARKYLASRHNTLLAEALRDAERLRSDGETGRADSLASDARKRFAAFADASVPCSGPLDDIDSILELAVANPPLFKIGGELGRLLDARLKPDNLGIFLADPKVGKTTDLVSLAVLAARSVPTLLVSTGDESKKKLDARIATNISFLVTQPEFAGRFAMPVPDCQHNADGSCPIGQSGEPRQAKSWRTLIEDGAEPEQLAAGSAEGSSTVGGGLYAPCCRCYPTGDGSREDAERRKNWKSAVWWRMHDFGLVDRQALEEAKKTLAVEFGGSLRTAAYPVGELSVGGLDALLDSLDRTDGFVPSVIVIDYADLMKQELGRESDKDYDGMRRIWEGLRAISSKYNVLLLTATQTNRLGEDCETHTRRTIGRSAKAADNCTWFVSLNQTVVERRAKVMRVSVMYAREGRYDPERQALCCQWHEIQDGFPFSMPVFCKIKNEVKARRD